MAALIAPDVVGRLHYPDTGCQVNFRVKDPVSIDPPENDKRSSGWDRKSQLLKACPVAALRQQLCEQLSPRSGQGAVTIWLDTPSNLYLLDSQADRYLETVHQPSYTSQLYEPLLRTIRENAESILAGVSGNVDFVDLGPGLPDKTLPLIEYLQENTQSLRYVPVDISVRFLSITAAYLSDQQLDILPLRVLFEELPVLLDVDRRFGSDRFFVFNLGLTFCNFHRDKVLTLFHDLMVRRQSVGIIATELLYDDNMTRVLLPYQTESVADFNFLMLQVVGLSRREFSYTLSFAQSRIQMGFRADRDVPIPGESSLFIQKGDEIITCVSYRYRSQQLLDVLNRRFSEVRLIKSDNKTICVICFKGAHP